jgi:hypothetical protein
LFITKTPTHYRDSNPGPLVLQSGPQTTRPAGRQMLPCAIMCVVLHMKVNLKEIVFIINLLIFLIAFLMDYPQGERAIAYHAGLVQIGG